MALTIPEHLLSPDHLLSLRGATLHRIELRSVPRLNPALLECVSLVASSGDLAIGADPAVRDGYDDVVPLVLHSLSDKRPVRETIQIGQPMVGCKILTYHLDGRTFIDAVTLTTQDNRVSIQSTGFSVYVSVIVGDAVPSDVPGTTLRSLSVF